MKKSDITAISLIVVLATILAFVLANTLIGSPQNDPIQVEVVTPIDSNFKAPDSRVFNDKAIDPTVDIKEGTKASQPFSN